MANESHSARRAFARVFFPPSYCALCSHTDWAGDYVQVQEAPFLVRR